MSFVTRKTLAVGLRLLAVLLSASIVIVVLKKNQDEDALKREQTLQIDVAFIIHGSKNITSPPRKESFKEALDWAKKITKAFGEVGVNKTRIGLILYAEKAKLMFNMTEKLTKGDVMGGLDEAGSPPALGNKTLTGKALKLALKTLVKETRKEAIKKFFVFTDRPPDDEPTSPAEAIKESEVEVYGLGGSTPPSTWFIHDFSLDSMYEMLKEGPFKGNKENMKDKSYQDITDISIPTQKPGLTIYYDSLKNSKLKLPANEYSMNASTTGNYSQFFSQNGKLQNPVNTNSSTLVSQDFVSSNGSLSNLGSAMSNPGNQVPHSGAPMSNHENQVSTPGNSESTVLNIGNQEPNPGNPVPKPDIPMSNSVNSMPNPGNIVNPGKEVPQPSTILNPINSKLEHQISGSISQENNAKEEEHTDIKYGKDAGVVITENVMKNRNAVGRYSSTIDVTPSATEFGTVIGGVRVHGQSKFDVFKPNNKSENSNLRSKLANENINKRRYKNHEKLLGHL